MNRVYHLSDFDYVLPEVLIAQHPLSNRPASRLLVVQENKYDDQYVRDLGDFLNPNDLLVINTTKVIAARLFGHKASGGQVEVLIERIQNAHEVLCQIRASKSPKLGSTITITDDHQEIAYKANVLARFDNGFYALGFEQNIFDIMSQCGHLPLPPYIDRMADDFDSHRYQTVFADKPGAVAAPTAGLHFDDALIDQLKNQGVNFGKLTLHVGAGTFSPVRSEDLSLHKMHQEWFEIDQQLVDQIQKTRTLGGKIVAVGTTSLRALESCAQIHQGLIKPMQGETALFITPGFEFKVVDRLMTNFHLPKSTLLMLVSAFAGFETIQHAYQHAIAEQYRFFSYGDAMLLTRQTPR